MNKIKEIFDGWSSLVWKKEKTETLAEKRMAVCVVCPDVTKGQNDKSEWMAACGICGCLLAAKTRSVDSSCPAGRWPE